MSGDRFFIVMLAVLLFVPFALAEVNLIQGSGPSSMCPGSTGLFRDVVENTGGEPVQVSVSSSGSASYFSTTVPIGFVLNPGQVRNIYTYVTPPSYTSVGSYGLDMSANSASLSHNVLVRDCFDYSITALNPENHVCPCGNQNFAFEITNSGDFSDTYALTVQGTAPGAVTLSDTVLSVNPGETRTFTVFLEATCDSFGEYGFTVTATPTNGASVKSASSTLVVDPCYDFGINTERDSVSMCEHSQETVAISVVNDGSTSNDFELELEGPAWANLDKNSLSVPAGSTGSANLVLSPDYGVQGSFEARLTVTPGMGNVEALNVFNLGVNRCHGVAVDIEMGADLLCSSLGNSYTVNVVNTGEFSKDYLLELSAPSWVTLDKRSISLGAGAEEQATITVNPGLNIPSDTYTVEVIAKAKDSSQVAGSDVIEIRTVSREECYMALIGVEDKNIQLDYDTTATIPIVVENVGTDAATYELSVGGTAVNFVYLNPSVVELEASKSELVYLHVAPTGDVPVGNYDVTVAARLQDSTILASEKIIIRVNEGEERIIIPEGEEGIQTGGDAVSPFQRLLQFFRNLFAPSPSDDVPEEETTDEETEEEEQQEEETEEEEQQEPEIVGELFDLEQEVPIQIGDEEHSVAYNERADDSIIIVISSDPVYVPLDVGESREVDLDGDGVNDVLVTFNGFIGEQADITYEVISDGLTYPEQEEEQQEEETGEDESEEEDMQDALDDLTGDETEETDETFLSSFVSSFGSIFTNAGDTVRNNRNKLIIIIVVLIVLILIFKTDFLKKFKGFFEEEIEEEPVIIEDKKEEPAKKEEKSKKEKKKKEEKLEDEEDFVIEFDEEEAEDKK